MMRKRSQNQRRRKTLSLMMLSASTQMALIVSCFPPVPNRYQSHDAILSGDKLVQFATTWVTLYSYFLNYLGKTVHMGFLDPPLR